MQSALGTRLAALRAGVRSPLHLRLWLRRERRRVPAFFPGATRKPRLFSVTRCRECRIDGGPHGFPFTPLDPAVALRFALRRRKLACRATAPPTLGRRWRGEPTTPSEMKKNKVLRRLRSSFLRKTIVVLFTTGALIAHAHDALSKQKSVAVYVEGPEASTVRATLVGVVARSATVDDAEGFASALAAQGQRAPPGKALDGGARARILGRLRAAGAARGVDAVLVVRVSRAARRHVVRLLLVESSGSESDLGSVPLDLQGDGHDDAALESTLSSALAPQDGGPGEVKPRPGEKAARAPEQTTPQAVDSAPVGSPTAGPAESPGSASSRPHGVVARSLFEAEIGAEAAGRHFAYHDGLTSNLRSYSIDVTPMLSASAELFPLAGAGAFLRDVGFIGGYSRSLFLKSAMSGGPTLSSVESSYFAGLRVRIHPDGNSDSGFLIGISDAYADQAFDFESTGGSIDTQVPTVDYRSNRTALDARIPLGPLTLLAAAGFRVVFDAGEVSQRFRSSTVEGLDGEVGLALAIAAGWEARLIADYQRYFYSFKPVPGDAFVAGGALDQFYGGRLAIAYVY
jgi:hypothetical protein